MTLGSEPSLLKLSIIQSMKIPLRDEKSSGLAVGPDAATTAWAAAFDVLVMRLTTSGPTSYLITQMIWLSERCSIGVFSVLIISLPLLLN